MTQKKCSSLSFTLQNFRVTKKLRELMEPEMKLRSTWYTLKAAKSLHYLEHMCVIFSQEDVCLIEVVQRNPRSTLRVRTYVYFEKLWQKSTSFFFFFFHNRLPNALVQYVCLKNFAAEVPVRRARGKMICKEIGNCANQSCLFFFQTLRNICKSNTYEFKRFFQEHPFCNNGIS